MVGTAPLLMAVTYASTSPASMGPVRIWLPSRLGCACRRGGAGGAVGSPSASRRQQQQQSTALAGRSHAGSPRRSATASPQKCGACAAAGAGGPEPPASCPLQTLLKMSRVRRARPSRNSGRSCAGSSASSCASLSSSFMGRTSVKQSRSGKSDLMDSRIWGGGAGRGAGRAAMQGSGAERAAGAAGVGLQAWMGSAECFLAGGAPAHKNSRRGRRTHKSGGSRRPQAFTSRGRAPAHLVLGLHGAPAARQRLQRGLQVVARADLLA